MTNLIRAALFGALFAILISTTAQAASIDLSTFNEDNTFNFSGGQGAGNWNVATGGGSVLQTENGDATMFLSPTDFTNSTISGTFAESDSDDDFVGFVFGFQNHGAFYLFDWKQGTQNAYGDADRGIALKRIDSTPTTHQHLWQTASTPGIVTNLYHQDLARDNGTTYTFNLTFTTPIIKISLLNGPTEIANFIVNDGTYGTGKFGFYNFSEASVTYTGFTADPAPPANSVPVPAALPLGLAGFGLCGLVSVIRRRRASK